MRRILPNCPLFETQLYSRSRRTLDIRDLGTRSGPISASLFVLPWMPYINIGANLPQTPATLLGHRILAHPSPLPPSLAIVC